MNERRYRIDDVFVGESTNRPDNAGRVVGASLAFDGPRTGTFASDHYGLCVDITWPARSATLGQQRP